MNYRRQLTSRFGRAVGGYLALAMLVGGCSASSGGLFGAGGSGGSASNTSNGSGNTSSDPGDLTTAAAGGTDDPGPGTGTGAGGFGEGCASSTTTAKQLPLDMYIMLDQSDSMNESAGSASKWDVVTEALGTFLKSSSAGISVGLQFFPLERCDSFSCATICDVPTYANPNVEIAPLPDVAAPLIKAMGDQTPQGGTPTSSALKGAIQHAQQWAQQHPTHITIVVLATDGEPSECKPIDLPSINNIAAGGVAGTPKILTYVIGVGKSLNALNDLAAAGGTGQAFLVDTAQNPGQQFLDAMNKIRGAALSCSYTIPVPMSGTPDFSTVNVQYTPGSGGKPVIFPKVADKAHCEVGVDSWYYDNNTSPKLINLCNSTCTKLTKDTKGKIDIVLGCGTVVR